MSNQPHLLLYLELRLQFGLVFLLQCNTRWEHPIAPEIHHKHRKHQHHAAKTGRNHDVKYVRGFLQLAGIVEVHSEDPRDISTEPKTTTQNGEYRVGDEQLIARGIQAQVQLGKGKAEEQCEVSGAKIKTKHYSVQVSKFLLKL